MLHKTLFILILVLAIVVAVDKVAKNITVEELEKQKSALYKQINVAIDESVKSLLQVNDTEANLGLKYMQDLKQHIKELNGADNTKEVKGIVIDSKSDLENRRNFKGFKYLKNTRRPKNDPIDFEALLKPKDISEREWMEMVANRQKMQKKLDTWILEREREKQRIKQYRMEKKRLMHSGKYEKCPRFGYYGKKKGEKKNRRDRIRPCVIDLNITAGKEYAKCPIPDVIEMATQEDQRRDPATFEYKYPCCRKCCKRSYMGCL